MFQSLELSGAAELYCRLGNEKAGTFRLRPFTMVRAGGVEPPRAYTHCHLKTARLPFRHARRQSTNLHQNLCNLKSACRAAIFRRKIQAARREEGGSPVGFRTTEPSLNFAIFRRKIQAARRSVCPILAFRTSSECFLGCLLVRFSRIGQVEREISIVVVRFARIGHVGHETCGVVVRFSRIGHIW